MRRWTLAPRADQDALGAALRHAVAGRADRTPRHFSELLDRLEARKNRAT